MSLHKAENMEKDDLTLVKHVGAARMKRLNDFGITTIRQLYEAPLEQLAQIEIIGEHYAKLIKEAVSDFYGEKYEKKAPKSLSGKEKKTREINHNLSKQIKILRRQLTRVSEKFKPLGKKKYLALYIDFKKRSKTLKTRLKELNQIRGALSRGAKKNIIKAACALNATLKKVGGKPKKKVYIKCVREIQLFSKLLKKTCR